MLNLDTKAQQLLSFVQQQTTKIDRKTEQAIITAQEQAGAPLTGEKLQEVLCKAMPEHSQTIKQISKKTLAFHCDNTNAAFLSQIVGLHEIEKERNAIYTAPHIARPARDPLSAKLIMAKNADLMLIFNASQFDDAGRPLLMKIVAREKMQDKLPDISNYYTLSKTPDVQYVANDAAYVAIKDENEAEFQFGSAMAQISLDGKGNELSRSGAVNPGNKQVTRFFYGVNQNGVMVPNLQSPAPVQPQVLSGVTLDTTPVQTYKDRIQLTMSTKDSLPPGAWLDAGLEHVEAKLSLEPGYMLEPDSKATISFANASVKTEVGSNDFSFVGSPSAEANVPTEQLQGWTIGSLLGQSVTEQTGTNKGTSDSRTEYTTASELIYSNAEHIQIGAVALEPLGDRTLKMSELAAAGIKARLEPLPADGEKNGQEVHLELDKGFLAGKEPGSVDGWKIVVGFHTGANGSTEWREAKPRFVDGQSSKKETFKIDLPNAPEAIANNRSVEIRIFNDRGVPAQRVLVPFTELPWGASQPCSPAAA